MQRGHLGQGDGIKKKELRIGLQILLAGLWPPYWETGYGEMFERIPWQEEESGFLAIKRNEFKRYITDELCQYALMWKRIKKYGWPQGRGYLCEPKKVVEIVELFDNERDSFVMSRKNQER